MSRIKKIAAVELPATIRERLEVWLAEQPTSGQFVCYLDDGTGYAVCNEILLGTMVATYRVEWRSSNPDVENETLVWCADTESFCLVGEDL